MAHLSRLLLQQHSADRGCEVKQYKPVILIVLTVVVALTTSLLTYRWFRDRSAGSAQRGGTVPVVVAVTDLSWGATIKPEMVKTVPSLKGSLSGVYSDPAAVEGRVILTPVKAGEPIFESRLAPKSIKEGGVAAVISENKRAMSVKVNKMQGVSGFIHPGNRVDVVATFRPARSLVPVAMTVLEDVPVLATGTETEIRDKQEKPVEVDVITLEVSADEAEVLGLAQAEGKIQLALRNFSDTKSHSGKRATTVDSLVNLLSGKGPVKEEKKVRHKKPAGQQVAADYYSKVQLIEGHKVNDVKIKEGGE